MVNKIWTLSQQILETPSLPARQDLQISSQNLRRIKRYLLLQQFLLSFGSESQKRASTRVPVYHTFVWYEKGTNYVTAPTTCREGTT